jgi:carboxyl-terminal processing protease
VIKYKEMDDFDRNDTSEEGMKNRSLMKIAAGFALVAALSFVGGLTVGAKGGDVFAGIPLLSDGLLATPDAAADLADFWKVWNVLENRFVQTHGTSSPPTSVEKLWGAIAGLTASYGDPYTIFMPPEEAKIFQEDIAGNFSGVGMEVGVKDEILTVIAPLKGTPADRAGIRTGDQIIMIDGQSTEGMSTDEAVKLIRGEKGTTVKFNMVRAGEPIEISVVRDIIDVPTIHTEQKDGVFIISLYSFTANSGSLFNKALAEFRQSGSRMLLIDLRGDPGGYLEAAVSIASHFLADGEVVVTEDYAGHQENIVHRSRGTGGIPAGTKVAILIDGGSASASEILSGALQDHGIATLIGTRSFGKGSVQELVKVGDASLKVTVARWLTPSGRSISNNGLTPDINVEITREQFAAGQDPQKDRAVQFLTTGE